MLETWSIKTSKSNGCWFLFCWICLLCSFLSLYIQFFVCSTTLERALSRLVVSWWLARIPSVLYLQELCENLLYLQEVFGNICCHQFFLRSRIFLYMHEIFIQEIAQPIIKDLKYHKKSSFLLFLHVKPGSAHGKSGTKEKRVHLEDEE